MITGVNAETNCRNFNRDRIGIVETANRPFGLVLTAAPADTETLDTNQLLRDAMELCRRLNIEAVKVRVGKITYYAHKDHVVRKIRSRSYDVLKEPFNAK